MTLRVTSTTRDTNIVYLTNNISGGWSSSYTKPFTLTGINSSGTQGTSTLTISSRIQAYQDVRIEHIRMNSGQALTTSDTNPAYNSSGYFFGNFYNVKIGRGITRSNNSNATISAFIGGTYGTSVPPINADMVALLLFDLVIPLPILTL